VRVTYLGHAGYLVELRKSNILLDPAFTPSIQAGTARISPSVEFDLEFLPRIDAIVLTHSHPGHVEIPTLARLDRDVSVFHPPDPTIDLILDGLGFGHHHEVTANCVVDCPDGRWFATGSSAPYPEIGVFFEAEGASFWYLADSTPDDTTLGRRLSNRNVDLLVSNFPAYHHRFFTRWSLEPDLSSLGRALEVVATAKPRLHIPNFTGLVYVGDAAWINRFMFPMTPAQYLSAVARVSPETPSAMLRPGDVVKLPGEPNPIICRQESNFVRVTGPDDPIQFDPTEGLPALSDPNFEGHTQAVLEERVRKFIHGHFVEWLGLQVRVPASGIGRLAAVGARYLLTVVYPAKTESWIVHFGPEIAIEPVVPERESPSAEIGLRIAASVLDAWSGGRLPYFVAYCYARPWGGAWSVGRLSDNSVGVRSVTARDPVADYLSSDVSRSYHPWVRAELARYGAPP
jgi:hypothetical protein